MQTHVTSKGQIVIPSELRKKYKIAPGTRLEIIDDGDQIILRPITPEFVRSLRGYLGGAGALKILEQERLAERED
jgi:AbrB family looped-hinge helix DNA binding protein